MKLVIGTVATISGVLFALSMASANPSLLPKHEGYPMKNSGSPVTGQPTANDPGQSDARGENTLMKSADSVKNAQQNLMKTDNARITTGQGANQLPTVQGPQIKITPPVTSATKIAGDGRNSADYEFHTPTPLNNGGWRHYVLNYTIKSGGGS